MEITVTIKTGNAAFEDHGYKAEVRRIVYTALDRMPDSSSEVYESNLRDINGNTVGTIVIHPESEASNE